MSIINLSKLKEVYKGNAKIGKIYKGSTLLWPIHTCEWNLINQILPTCTSEGRNDYSCTCGKTKSTQVAATGHNYLQVSGGSCTCYESIVVGYECQNCGHTYETTLPYTGHTFVNGVCVCCGEREECTHIYEKVYEEDPTCTENGYVIYKCNICGEEYQDTIPALGDHNYERTNDCSPTCYEDGYEEYTCTQCGDTYLVTIPRLEHYYNEGVCVYCGDNLNYNVTVGLNIPSYFNGYAVISCSYINNGETYYEYFYGGNEDSYTYSILETPMTYSELINLNITVTLMQGSGFEYGYCSYNADENWSDRTNDNVEIIMG